MHILAVDDEPSILELLEEIVHHFTDHTVETASCVTDALALCSRPNAEPFDCFLLDIQMPDTDGIQLCRILRNDHAYRDTPILMLTAMSDKSYIDRAFAAGANDYLSKPFQIEQLRGRLGIVESLVNSRKERNTAVEANHAEPRSSTLEDADTELQLYEPFSIKDVDGVIELKAMQNYISVMTDRQIFGSSVIAFSIRDIEKLFQRSSRFEFECLITDVSEAISDSFDRHQFLIAYTGNGTFVCVVERGWQPDPARITDKVNLTLHQLGLHFSDGSPMPVRVCAGDLIRLVWNSGDRASNALAAAHESAERERQHQTKTLEDFWYRRYSA